MLRSEQLLPNLLKRCKLSSVKLISKRTHVRGLSVDWQQSSKLEIMYAKTARTAEININRIANK